MMYLSKGIVCKRKSNDGLYIRHFGQPMVLFGDEADMWQRAHFGFAYAKTRKEIAIVDSLIKKGIAVSAKGDGELDKYYVLCRCAVCANPKFKIGITPLNEVEKRVYIWLKKGGTNLSLPELVALEEKQVRPNPELLCRENSVKLLKIIYPWTVSMAGELENKMKFSIARKRTVDAVLVLLRKKRIVMM